MIDEILLAKQLAKITGEKFTDDEAGFLEWAESIISKGVNTDFSMLEVKTKDGLKYIDMDDVCYFRMEVIRPKFDAIVAETVSTEDLDKEDALEDYIDIFRDFCAGLDYAIRRGQESFRMKIGDNFYSFNVLDFITAKSFYDTSMTTRVNEHMVRAIGRAARENNEDSSTLIRRAISTELERLRD